MELCKFLVLKEVLMVNTSHDCLASVTITAQMAQWLERLFLELKTRIGFDSDSDQTSRRKIGNHCLTLSIKGAV